MGNCTTVPLLVHLGRVRVEGLMDKITELINEVVYARKLAQQATELRKSSYQTWVDANQHFIDSEKTACEVCLEAETELRKLAIQLFEANGEKIVAPGVGIRMLTKISYDEKEALEWAMDHKLALKLDGKKFSSLAKDGTIDFVVMSEEPQATIASELVKVEGVNGG